MAFVITDAVGSSNPARRSTEVSSKVLTSARSGSAVTVTVTFAVSVVPPAVLEGPATSVIYTLSLRVARPV